MDRDVESFEEVVEQFLSVVEVFTSLSRPTQCRQWSQKGMREFKRDCAEETVLCKTLGTKITITEIRNKLAEKPVLRRR